MRPAADGSEVAVINLAGELYLGTGLSPFRIVDRLVEEAQGLAETIVVDLHAEATSEKVAMGHYLDGRVTAVLGTHTHVQTSDARVLRGGTAYMTDVGMTGPLDSVIGVRTDIILQAVPDRTAAAVRGGGGPGAARRGADRGRGRQSHGDRGVRGRHLGHGCRRAGAASCGRGTRKGGDLARLGGSDRVDLHMWLARRRQSPARATAMRARR